MLRLIDKLQFGAVPKQSPFQLTNDLPAGGVAVSVTIAPWVNFAEQVLPQLMLVSLPAGMPVMVPGLLWLTDKVYCGANVAFTFVTPLTVTEQVSCLPLHRPLQPVNTFPLLGFAVKVYRTPLVANVEQLLPQLIALVASDTEPLPVFTTESASGLMFTAVLFAPIKLPNSPVDGAVHMVSAQTA